MPAHSRTAEEAGNGRPQKGCPAFDGGAGPGPTQGPAPATVCPAQTDPAGHSDVVPPPQCHGERRAPAFQIVSQIEGQSSERSGPAGVPQAASGDSKAHLVEVKFLRMSLLLLPHQDHYHPPGALRAFSKPFPLRPAGQECVGARRAQSRATSAPSLNLTFLGLPPAMQS